MDLLVYCIFRRGSELPDANQPGVGGQRVFLVEGNGLFAAVSGVCGRPLTMDSAELMTYGKVVGALHRSPATGGVIPMRYGNLLAGEAGVRRHLNECGRAYADLLQIVAGCDEMGLRLLLPAPSAGNPPPARDAGCEQGRSGADYLTARKRHYAGQKTLDSEKNRLTQRCRAAFGGQFTRWESECRTVTDPHTRQRQILLSLFFLVPRPNLSAFLQTYRQLQTELPGRALLSGPWPPYNFVRTQRTAALSDLSLSLKR